MEVMVGQKAYCNLDDIAQLLLALNHLYKVVSVEMNADVLTRIVKLSVTLQM